MDMKPGTLRALMFVCPWSKHLFFKRSLFVTAGRLLLLFNIDIFSFRNGLSFSNYIKKNIDVPLDFDINNLY